MHLRTLSAVVLGLGMTLAGKAQTSLPYSQSFNTEADFNSFTFTDANADGFSWLYDNFNYEIGCERNMYADADDWLFSPVFHLQAGTTYTLAFDGHARYDGNDETFDVCLGTRAQSDAMTTVLLENQVVNESYTKKHFKTEFTVEADGDYHFAFHHKTTGVTWDNALLLDDITLEAKADVAEEARPGTVTDLTFSYDYDTRYVKLKWKAPTTGTDGQPIDASALTYTVTRLGTSTPLVQDYPGTTFREELKLSDLGKSQVFFDQGLARYHVVAKDAKGLESDKVYSNFKVIGTPYELPYKESFAGGQVSSFWGESHEGVGRWLPLQASNKYTQDGDEGMYCFTSVQDGDEGLGFSGLIALGDATNPVLSFWYYYTQPECDTVQVMIATDTKDFEKVMQLDMTSPETFRTWNHVTIPLSDYANSRFIQIAFHNHTSSGTSLVYVDNIKVFNQVERDLAVEIVSLPVNLRTDEPREAVAHVRNNGMNTCAEGDYQVEFVAGDQVLASVSGTGIAPGQGIDLTLPLNVPPTLEGDSVNVFARVVSEGDEWAENDQTPASRVRLIQPSYPAPQNLTCHSAGWTATLTWDAPAALRTESKTVTDSFEDAPDFTIENWGDWVLYDKSGYIGCGIDQYDFPNMGKPQAFTVLNPKAAGMSTGWSAHSGEKLLAAFASGMGAINHWLVSPELSRAAQTISFYAKAYSSQYEESFEVLSSSESIDPASFSLIASHTTAKGDTQWKEYTAELPEGTKYFAIRATSNDKFALLIDDITFVPDSCGAQAYELLGYNVYRDGVKLNETPVVGTTFSDTQAEGTHTYRVSAVYSVGESLRTEEVSLLVNGVQTVTAEAEDNAPIYDLQGRRVKRLTPGLYIQGSRKMVVPASK